MFILKVRTETEIKTFSFQLLMGAENAMTYIMKTTADAFIAEVKTPEDKKGIIIKKHFGLEGMRKLSYSQPSRRYADCVWYQLGTEQECKDLAKETNSKITSWASVSARVEHIIGPLWQVVYTDPYKD